MILGWICIEFNASHLNGEKNGSDRSKIFSWVFCSAWVRTFSIMDGLYVFRCWIITQLVSAQVFWQLNHHALSHHSMLRIDLLARPRRRQTFWFHHKPTAENPRMVVVKLALPISAARHSVCFSVNTRRVISSLVFWRMIDDGKTTRVFGSIFSGSSQTDFVLVQPRKREDLRSNSV